MNNVYFASEIDATKFGLGPVKHHNNNTDTSTPMLIGGRPIVVQMDDVKMLFGVMSYQTPQAGHVRRSTAICAQADELPKDECDFLQKLEAWVKGNHGLLDNPTFYSTVKASANGESHIRVKIPGTRNERANITLYVNEREYHKPAFETLATYLEHNTKASVIIELGDVWCSGGKFGVSWKLKSIAISTPLFRRPAVQP